MAPGVGGETLAHLLSHAERRITAQLGALLGSEGVTVDEWRVLAFLAQGPGRGMGEVAAAAMLPPPTSTKLVDRLVAANLVYRGVDSADRRRVLVFLTARGRALHRRLERLVQQSQADLERTCGAETVSGLTHLLSRLIRDVDGHPTASRSAAAARAEPAARSGTSP